MKFSRQVIQIKTGIRDVATIDSMVQPVIDFSNKHGINIKFQIGSDTDNQLISICEAEGVTSAYCKGMVAEVKQMLKDIFKCRLDVIFYAY